MEHDHIASMNQFAIDANVDNEPSHGVWLVRSHPTDMQQRRVLVKTFRFLGAAQSYADARNATARRGEKFEAT